LCEYPLNNLLGGPKVGVDDDDEDVEDPVLVDRAVRFFTGNIFSFFVCMLSGLVGLMFLPGAVKVLSATHKSDNPLRVKHFKLHCFFSTKKNIYLGKLPRYTI
jgi:hypothetical protein